MAAVELDQLSHDRQPEAQPGVMARGRRIALAKAFGAKGYRCTTVKELRTVLAAVKGLKDVPALVEVVIPEKDGRTREKFRDGIIEGMKQERLDDYESEIQRYYESLME